MTMQFNSSKEPNCYTAEDYRKATNNYQRKDYKQLLAEAEAEGNGLGFVYMSTVEKTVNKWQKDWIQYDVVKNFGSRSSGETNDTVRLINKFNKIVRNDVDRAMQEYIIEHEGYIDSWPISKTELGFYSENRKNGKTEDILLQFDYFSSDFREKDVETVGNTEYTTIGRDPGLTYRAGCSPVDSDEYTHMNEQIKKMKAKKTVTKEMRGKNNRGIVIPVVLGILVAIPLLLMVFWKLLGIDGDGWADALQQFAHLGKAAAIIALIPWFLLTIIQIIYALLCLSNTVFWVTVIILLGCTLAFIIACLKMDKWISKAEVEESEANLKAIEAMQNSDEYKRVQEENKEYIASQQQFAEVWHKKWFEFCEKHIWYYL